MFRSLLALSIALLCTPALAQDLDFKLVTELPRSETYHGHVVHDGYLWASVSPSREDPSNHIKIFDMDGNLVKKMQFPHSTKYIAAHGPHSIVLVGKTRNPWQSHFAIISRRGGNISTTSTTTIRNQQLVEKVVSDGNRIVFADPGSRGIFLSKNNRVRKLNVEVSYPDSMHIIGDTLWVLAKRSMVRGDENIHRINLNTEKDQLVFPQNRLGLSDITPVNNEFIVGTENDASRIVIVEAATGTEVSTFPIEGEPYGITNYGQCAIVLTEDTKLLTFVKIGKTPELIGKWDLNGGTGDLLKYPRLVSIDKNTGAIFVRSSTMCDSDCNPTYSSIFRVTEANHETLNKCL